VTQEQYLDIRISKKKKLFKVIPELK